MSLILCIFHFQISKRLMKSFEKKMERDPFESKNIEPTQKLELNEEQQNAYDAICNSMDELLFSEFLNSIFG